MPATTTQPSDEALQVYRVRDDLARRYTPADAHELMLVTQMAQAWVRLQDAYLLEQRYRQDRDMLVVISTKLAEFKAVTGYVRDCERSWNRAKENIERAQRQRRRTNLASPNARRACDRPPMPRPVETVAVPSSPTPAPANSNKRE